MRKYSFNKFYYNKLPLITHELASFIFLPIDFTSEFVSSDAYNFFMVFCVVTYAMVMLY